MRILVISTLGLFATGLLAALAAQGQDLRRAGIDDELAGKRPLEGGQGGGGGAYSRLAYWQRWPLRVRICGVRTSTTNSRANVNSRAIRRGQRSFIGTH